MIEAPRIFSAGIVDFNTRRMTPEQTVERGIPQELAGHVADLRQYPIKIAEFLPEGTVWFDPEQPWYFRSVLGNRDAVQKLQQSEVLILSGSGMSAYKFQEGEVPADPPDERDVEHLQQAETIVRDHLGQGKWVLGICFGGQLSMHAVGGTLGRLPNNEYGHTVTEAGFLPHQLTEAGRKDEVFGGLPDIYYASHFHSDYVDKLPRVGTKIQTSSGAIEVVKAEVLAIRQGFLGRNGSENQGKTYTHAAVVEFDNGARLYHSQPHLEMSKEGRANFFIRKVGWLLAKEEEMGEEYARRAGEVSVADYSASSVITEFAEAYKNHLIQDFWQTVTPAAIYNLQQYLEE